MGWLWDFQKNWFSSHFQFMSTAERFTSMSRDCNFFSNNNIFLYQSLSFLKEFLNVFEVSRICILNFGICNILLITLILLNYNKLAIHNTYKCDIFSGILSIIEFIPLLIPSKNSKRVFNLPLHFSSMILPTVFPITNPTMAKYLHLVNVFPISSHFIKAKNYLSSWCSIKNYSVLLKRHFAVSFPPSLKSSQKVDCRYSVTSKTVVEIC